MDHLREDGWLMLARSPNLLAKLKLLQYKNQVLIVTFDPKRAYELDIACFVTIKIEKNSIFVKSLFLDLQLRWAMVSIRYA
jgi:hypothetical protein